MKEIIFPTSVSGLEVDFDLNEMDKCFYLKVQFENRFRLFHDTSGRKDSQVSKWFVSDS